MTTDTPECSAPPLVFISYSHDSREHKRWVGELANRLMSNGVNVLLDQWELEPGDDVAAFMERAVVISKRVLMICTDSYVTKANDGKGGVGYEKMIVTGQLVQDLGTRKFVPVVRQETGKKSLPNFMASRFYVDLSDWPDSDDNFQSLLRTLHKAPENPKPVIGPNPFDKEILDPQPLVVRITPANASLIEVSPEKVYSAAVEIVHRQDQFSWRKLIQRTRLTLDKQYEEWGRGNVDLKVKEAASKANLVLSYTHNLAPLISLALAGIESADQRFNKHVSLVEDILRPKGWISNGIVAVVELPLSAAFICQALMGAAYIQTNQAGLAIELARAKVDWGNGPVRLYEARSVIGWPDSLERNCVTAWEFLSSLIDHWKWLQDVFGSADDYRAAISAYYMMLNVLEFGEMIKKESLRKLLSTPQDLHLDIPIAYEKEPDEVLTHAYRLLKENGVALKGLFDLSHLGLETVFSDWTAWIQLCDYWIHRVYPYRIRGVSHSMLIQDLYGTPNG